MKNLIDSFPKQNDGMLSYNDFVKIVKKNYGNYKELLEKIEEFRNGNENLTEELRNNENVEITTIKKLEPDFLFANFERILKLEQSAKNENLDKNNYYKKNLLSDFNEICKEKNLKILWNKTERSKSPKFKQNETIANNKSLEKNKKSIEKNSEKSNFANKINELFNSTNQRKMKYQEIKENNENKENLQEILKENYKEKKNYKEILKENREILKGNKGVLKENKEILKKNQENSSLNTFKINSILKTMVNDNRNHNKSFRRSKENSFSELENTSIYQKKINSNNNRSLLNRSQINRSLNRNNNNNNNNYNNAYKRIYHKKNVEKGKNNNTTCVSISNILNDSEIFNKSGNLIKKIY